MFPQGWVYGFGVHSTVHINIEEHSATQHHHWTIRKLSPLLLYNGTHLHNACAHILDSPLCPCLCAFRCVVQCWTHPFLLGCIQSGERAAIQMLCSAVSIVRRSTTGFSWKDHEKNICCIVRDKEIKEEGREREKERKWRLIKTRGKKGRQKKREAGD